jgi:hypothetical protein
MDLVPRELVSTKQILEDQFYLFLLCVLLCWRKKKAAGCQKSGFRLARFINFCLPQASLHARTLQDALGKNG